MVSAFDSVPVRVLAATGNAWPSGRSVRLVGVYKRDSSAWDSSRFRYRCRVRGL